MCATLHTNMYHVSHHFPSSKLVKQYTISSLSASFAHCISMDRASTIIDKQMFSFTGAICIVLDIGGAPNWIDH